MTPEITAAPSYRYGREEVALRQAADERWGVVMRSLVEHGNTGGPYTPSFAIRDGLLFKRGAGAGREWRLVVPNSLRMDVVRMCHNDASAGHEGEDKTWQRVHARFHFEGAQRYVKDFVASCAHCQLRKTLRSLPTGPLQPILAPDGPFMMWGLDHLGPLPLTEDGNRYALVAVDYFSKMVVAEAVADATAGRAIRFFQDRIVYASGVPGTTVSDQASVFTGSKWEEMTRRLNIQHFFAAAEHQQTNGLTEKNVGTLVDRIAAIAKDRPRQWDRCLSAAVFAINSSIQKSTGVSPFQVVTGLLPVLPCERILPCEVEVTNEGERGRKISECRERVSKRIGAAQAKQKEFYDRRRRPTISLGPGDLVVMRRKATKRGLAKKLQPRFTGPFRVVEARRSNTFLLEDLPSSRARRRVGEFKAHSSQLKKWRLPPAAGDEDDGSPNEEEEEAMTDANSGEEEEATMEISEATAVAEAVRGQGVSAEVTEDRRPQRVRRLPRFLQENYVMEGDETERDPEEEE